MTTIAPELPVNLPAEEAALGAALYRPDAVGLLAGIVRQPGDFYLARHQLVYAAMLDLHGRGVPCDVSATAGRLAELGKLDAVGGLVAIVRLADDAMPWNIEAYAEQVAAAALRRRLIDAGGRIAALAYQMTDADELIGATQGELSRASITAAKSGFVTVAAAMGRLFDQTSEGVTPGLETGYRDLDVMTGGLRGSELTILAARPGVGKTSLLLCIANHIARQVGEPALVFSLEMSTEMLVARLAAPALGIPLLALRDRKLSGDQSAELARLVNELDAGHVPLYIDDTPGQSVSAVRAACLKWAAEHGRPPGVIAIDYLQLLQAGERYRGNKVQEVAEISRSLVLLARELNVPVLALSQLSRDSEKRAEKVPVLADLRDSGALEQDAANVWFIYREELHDQNTEKKGVAEIHVAKQRSGPLGVVPLRFNPETTAFHNLSYRTPDGF